MELLSWQVWVQGNFTSEYSKGSEVPGQVQRHPCHAACAAKRKPRASGGATPGVSSEPVVYFMHQHALRGFLYICTTSQILDAPYPTLHNCNCRCVANDELSSRIRPPPADLSVWQSEALEFFRSRGISQETLEACGVKQENDIWCPAEGAKVPWAIAFPYYRNGEIINIKYRTLDKKFWQVSLFPGCPSRIPFCRRLSSLDFVLYPFVPEATHRKLWTTVFAIKVKGAEKILYGLDDVAARDEIIIVEGEMDKLSLYEAGITNAVSVPDGAPPKVSESSVPPPDQVGYFHPPSIANFVAACNFEACSLFFLGDTH